MKQLISFRNLSLGATNLDGLIEYKDKCYVIFELKYGACPLSVGQGLALERLCDDLERVKPTILILASHTTPTDDDVDAASASVMQYRRRGHWIPGRGLTLKHVTDAFLKLYGDQPITSGERP